MRWTDKQREIANLISQGKTFNEITAMGYSLNMTSRVKKAIEKGENPSQTKAQKGAQPGILTKVIPAADVKIQDVPSTSLSPLIFEISKDLVSVDRSVMAECYAYYKEVKKLKDGSFSDYLVASAARFWQSVRGEPRINKEGRPVLEVSQVGESVSGTGEGEVRNEQ